MSFSLIESLPICIRSLPRWIDKQVIQLSLSHLVNRTPGLRLTNFLAKFDRILCSHHAFVQSSGSYAFIVGLCGHNAVEVVQGKVS